MRRCARLGRVGVGREGAVGGGVDAGGRLVHRRHRQVAGGIGLVGAAVRGVGAFYFGDVAAVVQLGPCPPTRPRQRAGAGSGAVGGRGTRRRRDDRGLDSTDCEASGRAPPTTTPRCWATTRWPLSETTPARWSTPGCGRDPPSAGMSASRSRLWCWDASM